MCVEHDVGKRNYGERQMLITEITSIAHGAPFFGNEIDVLHDHSGEYYCEICGDDDNWMIGEYGETF